ncbi:MAG TPA: hypothetical protein ENK57_06440 [Polyangiaceae bacterium]|nr:hypothetical protein [Polyangiaceae bacterium]
MTRLRDIDPDTVAEQTHQALLGRMWQIAQLCGVTDPVAPSTTPSEAYLTVQALARYATTGAPPEGRLELVETYLLRVGKVAHLLGDYVHLHRPTTALGVVMAAAHARSSLDHDSRITSAQLAILASVTPGRIAQLQKAGDAPTGELTTWEGRPDTRMIKAREARTWLSGRGVAGF